MQVIRLLVLFFPLLCNGCGLIWIPYTRLYPDPVKTIRVFDAGTKKAINQAQIDVKLVPYENWAHFPPMVRPADSTGEARHCERQIKLGVQRIGDSFVIYEQRCLTDWVGWFFPIPNPLGWTLYKDHQVVIDVTAPDYQPLCFGYSWKYPPRQGESYGSLRSGDETNRMIEKLERCEYLETGQLSFFLVRSSCIPQNSGETIHIP